MNSSIHGRSFFSPPFQTLPDKKQADLLFKIFKACLRHSTPKKKIIPKLSKDLLNCTKKIKSLFFRELTRYVSQIGKNNKIYRHIVRESVQEYITGNHYSYADFIKCVNILIDLLEPNELIDISPYCKTLINNSKISINDKIMALSHLTSLSQNQIFCNKEGYNHIKIFIQESRSRIV